MAGLITICIPTYRRPTLLLATLLSCFAQDYRPLEIDIGDDSPGNESELLIGSLKVPAGVTLRYWRNRPGLGQAGNVNRLFAKARGERLVLLHDDDLLVAGAVSAMDEAWWNVPGVVAVYGMQQILTDNGELDQAETDFKAWYYKRDKAHVGEQHNLLVSALWRQFPNNGYLIEAEAARKSGYRSFEEVGHACDTDFSIRLARHAKGRCFFMIDRITSQYRYNVNSLSRSVDVTWKFYDYLVGLDNLEPAEVAARDSLLREIAAQATKENALRGRRAAALSIFFSRFYPRNQSLIKSLYHLGLTATPRVHEMRRLQRFFARATSPTGGQYQALTKLRLFAQSGAAGVPSSVAAPPRFQPSDGLLPLTITIVSQDVRYGHGQGRANLEVVREALRSGHRVHIVASDIDRSLCEDPGVTLHRLDVSAIPTQLLRDAVFDWRAQGVVRKLRAVSDIIHVNGAVVAAASDVNSAHFVHGSNARFHSGPWGLLKSPYRLYQFAYTMLNVSMERRSFRRTKSVIAVSQTVAADLIESGVDRDKLFVIYNGVDLDEFTPGHEDRAALGLPSEVLLGLFVGDIKGNRKNLDTVLKTMVLNADLHLAVLANVERSAARELAAELGISERIHFLGQRNDVAAIMRAADMLLFPSRYEPFGMVILEALASGLPVIASRAAGATEIFEPGCGIIIEDPNSIAELSQAISRLASDPGLREQMGRQGRTVAEKYSWTRMARQYITRYTALVLGSNDAALSTAVPAKLVDPIELVAS